MTALLSSIGTLATILISIAILLRITSVKEVGSFIGRAVMALLLMLVALCILKDLWVGVMIPRFSAAFEFLRTLIGWLLVAIVGLLALALVGRLFFRRRSGQHN